MHNQPNLQLRAIGLAIGGFTLWVLTDALMKLAAEAQLTPYQVIGVMGFVTVAAMLAKTRRPEAIRALWPRQLRGQLIVALFTLVTNYCNVIALRHLPFTVFYIAIFTAPMLVAILSFFFLKEPLGWKKFLVIVVGFCGVMIAIRPFGGDVSDADAIGYTAALASAACFAANAVLTRFLTRQESTDSLVFFNGLVLVVVSSVLALFLDSPPMSLYILLILLIAGVLNVVGNFLYTLGVKHAPAATIAPFHYTQIISGALIAFLMWREVPDVYFWGGAVLIVGSGIYIARTSLKVQQAEIAPH